MSNYLILYGKPRFLGKAEINEPVEPGTRVLITSPRGMEIGTVAGPLSETYEEHYSKKPAGPGEERSEGLHDVAFLERASEARLLEADWDRADEERALPLARSVLARHQLNIKLVDLEYLTDRKKLFFYFTAEGRVDFRAFVRDLAREFRTRIELRQIGARDEAMVLGGLGPCGRACCCNSFLHRFAPINIRMVKEQNLSLNPTKISGLCGRLMCCLSYEQQNYSEIWKNLPSPGTKIKTPTGLFILLGVSISKGTCQLKGPKGFFWLPVTRFAEFKAAVKDGEEWDNEARGLTQDGQPLEAEKEDQGLFGFSPRGCTGACRSGGCNCSNRSAAADLQERLAWSGPSAEQEEKKPRPKGRRPKGKGGEKPAEGEKKPQRTEKRRPGAGEAPQPSSEGRKKQKYRGPRRKNRGAAPKEQS